MEIIGVKYGRIAVANTLFTEGFAKDLQRKGKKKNEKLSKQMGTRGDSSAVAALQYRYGVVLVHLQPGDR